MKFSNLFAITLKEAPKDCVLKSYEYLIRGSFIKQVGSGIYHLLPLGKIVLDKISKIVKEEMDKSGAQEVSLGFVTPSELWVKSNRFNKYGKELLSFKDRKDNVFVLGPTYEESIVDCVKSYVSSYKQLPINLYQINLKFRDEIRPRFGLIRCREFIMKDAYSFHENLEDLDREFRLMEEVYINIFTRLGLDFRVVDADSGAIGGSGSKEFVILAPSGEDDIVICSNCNYASNIEVAKRKPKITEIKAPKADFAKFYTPSTTDVRDVSIFFNTSDYWILKCVVKKVIFSDLSQSFCFFFIRGSDKLSEIKAINAVDDAIELIDAQESDIENLGLFKGFIGPYGLRNITNAKYIIFDDELIDARDLICGANEENYHFVGVDLSKFENITYKPLVEVSNGDKCINCDGSLSITKGIEIGHIFKLGNRYSKSLNAVFLDRDGKSKYFEMGCYGIGVSRILPAMLEQKADSKGAIWGNVSPYSVVIIISNTKNEDEFAYANNLYNSLLKHCDVLLDDRDVRFGVKMSDFELIGFKNAIIIGKELKNNKIEFIRRDGLIKESLDSTISVDDILYKIGLP